MNAPQKTIPQAWRVDAPRSLTTDELSAVLRVKPATIRSGYCNAGHYMNLVPTKLPNRLLRWAAADVEKLLAASR